MKDKNNNDQNIKKWSEEMLRNGKKFSLFLFCFFIAFSGLGYLFINQFHDVKFFNKNIPFNDKVISALYENNSSLYLIEHGKEAEADKHFIVISNESIENYIKQMKQFQKNNKFSDELFKKFLEDNKISKYDVWKYAEQKVKNELFFNIFDNFPQNQFKFLDEVIDNTKIIDRIEGTQYILKNDFVNDKIDQFILNNNKDFEDYVKLQFKMKSHNSLTPELRTGFLIKLSNIKKSDISSEKMDNIIQKKLNRENAKDFIEKMFGINSNVEIICFDECERNTTISDLLFDKIDIYERNNELFIPVVEKIIPLKIKDFSEENLKILKESYKVMLFQKFGFIFALELSNDFNNKQIDINFLKKNCTAMPFVKYLNLSGENESNLFTVKDGSSCAIETVDRKSAIFVCNKKFFKSKNPSELSLLRKFMNVHDKILEFYRIGLLSYWKSNFEK